MFRQIILTIVASAAFFSACQPKTSGSDNWKAVYKNAYTNHDYTTAIVALNHLILTDTVNKPDYYDSLAVYYIKKQRNYTAGKLIVDKGLALSPDNYNFLEFKSIFLSAENKLEESRSMLQKAYKLSGLKKHLYMYATTYASDKNLDEYSKIVDGFLYDPATKPEKVEVSVDETTSQLVDIKALCYMDKAKIATNPVWIVSYIDSALLIEPSYQEALYFREKLKGNK